MNMETVHWREDPGEHELLRLELVGLAAEVATLSTRIDESLAEMQSRDTQFAALRESLSHRALSILAPQTKFDAISKDALRAALQILREDRRQILELRRAVERAVEQWELQSPGARKLERLRRLGYLPNT
jgi:hypothetical protein